MYNICNSSWCADGDWETGSSCACAPATRRCRRMDWGRRVGAAAAPATFVHDGSYEVLCCPVPVAHAAHYARHTCVEALNYCKPDLTTMVQQTGVLQERLQRRLLALYTPAISNIRNEGVSRSVGIQNARVCPEASCPSSV